MLFRQLFDAASSTYTYLLGDPASGEALLIDPVFEQTTRDLSLLQELGLTLKLVVDTHAHADHVTAAWLLKQKTGCQIASAAVINAEHVDLPLQHGQRFGVNYLVDVLQGKANSRIQQFGHDKLTVFGIGKELNTSQWRGLFRQLIARRLLSVDLDGHGSVQLSQSARPILRGEQTLTLRKLAKVSAGKTRSSNFANTAHSQLWEALRAHRKQLADEQGVPAYVIFHDATLAEMAERQPQNREQLALISGIGERKLDAYGDSFLEVIHENIGSQPQSGDSNAETVLLLCQGMTPLEIAHRRELTVATVYRHLAKAIREGELELADVVALDEAELQEIRFAFEHSEDKRLKPIYEALGGEYDYGILECVRAAS